MTKVKLDAFLEIKAQDCAKTRTGQPWMEMKKTHKTFMISADTFMDRYDMWFSLMIRMPEKVFCS